MRPCKGMHTKRVCRPMRDEGDGELCGDVRSTTVVDFFLRFRQLYTELHPLTESLSRPCWDRIDSFGQQFGKSAITGK